MKKWILFLSIVSSQFVFAQSTNEILDDSVRGNLERGGVNYEPDRGSDRGPSFGRESRFPRNPNPGYGPGHGGPTPNPGYAPGGPGYRPERPPMPPPAPPRWDDNYGPGFTVRWQDMGMFKIPKIIELDAVIQANGNLVNEVIIRSFKNRLEITDAKAFLTNGQVIDLPQLRGSLRDGEERRVNIDYRNSVRISRISMRATSPNLFGSLAQMSVILGFAR